MIWRIIIVLVMLSSLTGCLGIREMQDQTYVTTIGFDVEDEKIAVYFQALTFTNVSKKEGGGGEAKAAPVLIGKGTGLTIEEAFNNLEQNTAVPMHYGHIHTLIVSEKVMETKLDTIIDFMGRNSFLRYTTWFYGTNISIQDIMSSESYFGQPPLYSITLNPEQTIEQNSFLPVVTFQDFIADYYEPVGTSFIPALYIDEKTWEEGGKRKIAAIDGLFLFDEEKFKGNLTKDELAGLKWLYPETNKTFLPLDELKVSVEIVKPKAKIKVKGEEHPEFHVQIDADCSLDQNVEGLDVKTIEKHVQEKIENEIWTTYRKGLEMNLDLYNLTMNGYRYHNEKWSVSKLRNLSEDSLKVEVAVHVLHTGDYKK
ncbi:MAG: Ger(x)C family spore germination protein [Bacillota bacterium]